MKTMNAKRIYLLLVLLLSIALMLSACGAKPAEVVPAQPATATITPTSIPESKAYAINGITYSLNAPFPETPAEMKIYLAKDEVDATVDLVKALAKQFGMHGEIYETAGVIGGETTDYLVVDGNRQLSVRSDRYFTYYPDSVMQSASLPPSDNPNAEALIRDFMQAHGFDFEYKIEYQRVGTYSAIPLTPDGFVLQHTPFDENGLIFFFDGSGLEAVRANLTTDV